MVASPFHRAFHVALALAIVAPGAGAQAQSLGLRGSDSSGGFPTSPADAPAYVPDNNAPPSLGGSPAEADTDVAPATNATPSTTANQDGDDTGPNYGKPSKKKAKLYSPNPKTSVPLAPLVPYRGAPGPQQRLLNPVPVPRQAVDPTLPGPTVAVLQSPLRLKRVPVEDDPFAPTGVRIGTLRLLPFVETSAGYESNPNQVSAGVKPSLDLRVDGGAAIASDFSSGSLTANLRGGYSEFPANPNANRPDFSGIADGRIDVTRHDTIDLETRALVSTQTPGSPLLAVPGSVYITDRPTITSEGATLGATHVFNRLSVGLRTTIDRTQFGDATQSDGTIYRYSQDNFNDYGLVARASYELTPGLVPFTEVGFDDRVRDNPVDLSGYLRDSTGVFARAGSLLEFGRIFTGTLSAGYADRHYADPRLPNLRGPTLDGSIVYAVTPITTLTFRANTTLAETTLPGASGAISRLVSLELAHVFFRNFTVSGIVTYQPNEYEGIVVHEAFSSETLKAAYAFNREVSLIATASHQQLASSLTYSAFKDNVILLGVRMQR